MASTTRALILSLKPFQIPHLLQHQQQHQQRHLIPFLSPQRHLLISSPSSSTPVAGTSRRCTTKILSVLGGGGLSDIRKSEFSREFLVIATMLKRIEPLDTSDISKGVSESAKDSMKQAISTMLGLLPSDQFSVSVRVSQVPLHRLLVSSIITGYTLWNAEYRISLMRNFELSIDSAKAHNSSEGIETLGLACERQFGGGVASTADIDSPEQINSHSLKGMSREALRYIQQLEAELCSAKQELDAQKKDSVQMASNRGDNNNLLEYLRSLEAYMVTELSQPSSIEVKEVIHELVLNTIHRLFKHDDASEQTDNATMADHERREMFTTSRDYLAKLLFWCMLLGHHLRGLENRLHLSCVVGLL